MHSARRRGKTSRAAAIPVRSKDGSAVVGPADIRDAVCRAILDREQPMGVLSAAQRQHFDDEGYLVVEGVLDEERDIRPLMAEYNQVLDGIARALRARGAIQSTYDGLPFTDRLIQICQESGQ